MTLLHKITAVLLLAATLMSCEDPIDVDTGFENGEIVVDAWITNESTPQTIKLLLSQDYFDNRLPTPITDGTVTISSTGADYIFAHQGEGAYTWTPTAGETLGSVGDTFQLTVAAGGLSYTASTTIYDAPEIDSISIYLEDEAFGADEGLFAEVYARDLPGQGDTYWVKAYRNDTLLNKPQEINIVYDATFDAGSDIDGTYFIRPLRFAINALDDDGLPRALNVGDKVGVEIHSISNAGFRFMQTVQEQTTNGDNGIFALPVANALGNITNTADGRRALGFFNIATVTSRERVVE